MLDQGTATLRRARDEGWAVGAFSAYDLEQARAIARAAELERTPVILQAGSSAFRRAGRAPLAALALAVAAEADAPIGVHLDHCTDPDELRACLRAGYTSVMFDGSALPFADNVARTRGLVEQAHAAGAWVEAELGGIAGDEDRSTAAGPAAAALTDPDEAARFAELTGVDALAVAVGNVHGMTAAPTVLDLERLAAIGERVAVPLVLHGASGLPDDDVRAAIALGVAKINVNTELRRAYLAGARAALATAGDGDDLAPLFDAIGDAVCEAVRTKLRTYTPLAAGRTA